jgi:hypothetical protein
MEKRLKRLPTGIQTFSTVIEDGCVYVDKTQMLVNLVESGNVFFFARPRRFGKSLTISTLEALFQGRKELFKGLYAETWLNRPDFVKYPVIRLSMNEITTNRGIRELENSIVKLLKYEAQKIEVELPESDVPGELFKDLIVGTSKKYEQKVVVLIDEYDKPYIDFVDNHKMAEKVRDVLANFYVRVKANDEYIRFVLLTGISKFAKLGVFSKLNNLTDISLRDEYAALCGITHEELLANFPDHLEATAEKMEITKEELVDKMEDFYDGFSFNGKVKVYNPYSTLRFFEDKNFDNYWFDGGTSTMVATYLKKRDFTVEQFRNFPVSRDFSRNPGEMDSTPPEGFLYQSGFLTLREGVVSDYALDYPNKEVLNTMSRLLSDKLLKHNYSDITNLLYYSLLNKNFEELKNVLNNLLASIPYDDYTKALAQKIKIQGFTYPAQEWLYRSTIFAFMRGCGLVVQAEMHTNLGRADLVINYRGQIWIFEIKVAYKGESPAEKAEEAFNQIFKKNYNKPYSTSICVGLAIDDEKRQITEYKF